MPRYHTKQNENYYTINRNLSKILSLFACSKVPFPPPPNCPLSSPYFHYFSPLAYPTTPSPPPQLPLLLPQPFSPAPHLPLPERQYHSPSLIYQLSLHVRVVKSSQLLAQIGAYLVSICRLLRLVFLYGWPF